MSHELKDVPESWPVVHSTDVYRNEWVMALRLDEVRPPAGPDSSTHSGDDSDGSGQGETFERLVLEHPGAVVVLAVDDQRRAFCLWQYRHPAQRRFVELPAGLLDTQGESPLETARRELREEAGLSAEDWTPLGTTWSTPGITNEVMHLFLARDLTVVEDDFERAHEEADMASGWVPVDELRSAVLTGDVADGPLVQAVLLAEAKGLL
jgi:8-oxo-dGTP pyrophosphatase MutT (NUDIX family)